MAPAQNGLPDITPVVILFVTLVMPSIFTSSIEKAGSAATNSLALFCTHMNANRKSAWLSKTGLVTVT